MITDADRMTMQFCPFEHTGQFHSKKASHAGQDCENQITGDDAVDIN